MVTTRGRALDVLVVSHEASRTGAPRVAVEVLRALSAAGLSVQCLLRWPGPLQDDLLRAADGCRLEPLRRTRVLLRRFRRTRALAVRLEQRVARRVLLRTRPRSVYANTVLSACYVRPALRLGLPVVLHVHELEPLTSSVLNRYGISGPVPG